MNWQSIETAPKPDTLEEAKATRPILICANRSSATGKGVTLDPFITIAHWNGEYFHIEYSGWHGIWESDCLGWMPLPDPPKDTK